MPHKVVQQRRNGQFVGTEYLGGLTPETEKVTNILKNIHDNRMRIPFVNSEEDYFNTV